MGYRESASAYDVLSTVTSIGIANRTAPTTPQISSTLAERNAEARQLTHLTRKYLA
jgi:hypothetical protein